MFDPELHHKKRRKQARLLIFVAFILVRLGDPLLLLYSFQPLNPTPLLRGLVIGGIVSTTACFAVVWRRQIWARYLLIALLWLLMALFSVPAILAMGNNEMALLSPYWMTLLAVLFYGIANTLLIRSRRIRQFVAPQSSHRD
jgi:hypothetical protein